MEEGEGDGGQKEKLYINYQYGLLIINFISYWELTWSICDKS